VFSPLADSAIVGPTTASPHFTPLVRGFYVTRLDVSDGLAGTFDQMVVTVSSACDANADGKVDQIDLDLMNALVGQTALGGDPLDADKDGKITDNDVKLCAKKVGNGGGGDKGNGAIGSDTAAVATTRGAAAGAVLGQEHLAVSEVRNGASLLGGAVAPGEIVVITGSGFGGPAAVEVGRRQMPRELANVRVRFDGVAAALLYVTPNQLSAVVPHEVSGKLSTTLAVESGTRRSDPVVLPVAASAPGIFTLNGTAQAIAVNEDGTMNSAANPAAAGSVVTLFVSGVGPTDPVETDGLIIGDEQIRPRLAVRAMIAEAAAEVLSAGAAPGTPSDVIRVQVRIPAGAKADPAAAIAITVGGARSQAGVTIAIQ